VEIRAETEDLVSDVSWFWFRAKFFASGFGHSGPMSGDARVVESGNPWASHRVVSRSYSGGPPPRTRAPAATAEPAAVGCPVSGPRPAAPPADLHTESKVENVRFSRTFLTRIWSFDSSHQSSSLFRAGENPGPTIYKGCQAQLAATPTGHPSPLLGECHTPDARASSAPMPTAHEYSKGPILAGGMYQ
jgi:hypothetical protein